jgi:tetratricopeptide (TPR) repeat protein/TolB-like protein/predicted Ser/Thr protein kinase
MIGRTISQYRIAEEISRGGMGVVYRATDLTLGRDVALKVLPEELVHDPERRERLLQEARAASGLEHPHIAVIHAAGEADGVTFIAMELIRGEKLSDLLHRGPLTPKRALDLATEIAEGLARAHDRAIVHRDLKPANVMVTEEGHAKIIDFGLAKLVEPMTEETATAGRGSPRTTPGVVLGTYAYMSPEQARAGRVDHRSDIFSFGLLLHEMLTGHPAFQGRSSLDTLQAILTQPVPALPASAALPGDLAHEVQRIIAKCAEKDADDRYQGMRDVVVDLRAVRRGLESASMTASGAPPVSASAPAAPAPRRWRPTPVIAVGLALVAALALIVWRPWEPTPGPRQTDGKPSVAVLYFENNTGDESLDWMRTGLTDMMVTDLSQSADIEVLGTDRLVQILDELERADDRAISAEVVDEIARRAGVDRVLLGSYIKAGDTIRISARLQEATTGRIVTSERVEGAGESSLFSLVDELTRRIKAQMARLSAGPGPLLARPGAEPETGLDRGLQDITTSSVEAYRYYAEGVHLHERFLEPQAIPLLEKAIEIDPKFAMALAKLAVVSGNLGQIDKGDEYARRALDNIDRLTARERYYIEGYFYSLRPETRARGIQAYEQGLALHPEHQASRHNLAVQYWNLERFDKAVEHYEELRRRGTSFPTTYGNLAGSYIRLGDAARGREVIEEFLRRHPDSGPGHENLGETLIAEGRLPEALAAYDRAEALGFVDSQLRQGRWMVAVLQERWTEADAAAEQLRATPDPIQKWLAGMLDASARLAHGQTGPALDAFDAAARVPGTASNNQVFPGLTAARVLLHLGRPALAQSQLQPALQVARGRPLELDASRSLAVVQAAAGRQAEAEATLAALAPRVAVLPPGAFQHRQLRWARGEVALAAGDSAGAIAELTAAADGLAPRGPVHFPSMNVELWFSLASAYLAAGRDAEAAAWLERITAMGHERAYAFVPYVRSHFLLAQVAERRGDAARARQLYARFVDFWRDGDVDRARIAEARQKLAR